MGAGGYFNIINAAYFVLNLGYHHSWDMNDWDSHLPQNVTSGELSQFYIEQENSGDAGAEAQYDIIQRPQGTFVKIGYHDPVKATISVNGGQASSLNYQQDKFNPIIVTEIEGQIQVNSVQEDWMQSILPYIGCRQLREICLLGSHDAAMSRNDAFTPLASDAMVITQRLDIAGQLKRGSRYLDLRPMIDIHGVLRFGHFSNHLGWDGGFGQSVSEVVDQINGFTSSNKELVVLDLTHDLAAYTTEDANGIPKIAYSKFDDIKWWSLFKELSRLNHLYQAPSNTDLGSVSIHDFIGNQVSGVVVVARDFTTKNFGEYEGKGFYSDDAYSIFNSYSDENDVDKMKEDQIKKMRDHRKNPKGDMFLLSWTLTPELTLFHRGVIGLNEKYAHDHLYEMDSIWDAMTKNTYPNVVLLDVIEDDQNFASFVVAINRAKVEQCA